MRNVSSLVRAAVFLTAGCAAALLFAAAHARAQSPLQEEKTQRPELPRLKNFDPRLRQRTNEQAGAEGQKKGDDGGEDVIRVETTLVVSDVLVLDKQGRTVTGLKREDFVVREDDVPQEIGTFSLGSAATVPRSIVLVIDHSGSQLAYLKTSIEAAKTLVDKLGPRDRMAIVTDSVELLVDFTRDRALLKQTLDSLWQRLRDGQGGRSEHYSALLATLTELFDEEDLRPVVIFQADGDELVALKGNGDRNRYLRQRAFGFDDLLAAADRSRATVYTIIPGVRFIGLSEEEQVRQAKADMDNRAKAVGGFANPATAAERNGWAGEFYKRWAASMHRRQLAMAGLAKYTGGWADYLERPEDAAAVYARVFAGLNSRYVVGYYPTNRARDGKRRKVSIVVRGHPEYVVWGRKTYFAPGP